MDTGQILEFEWDGDDEEDDDDNDEYEHDQLYQSGEAYELDEEYEADTLAAHKHQEQVREWAEMEYAARWN